MKEIIYFHLSDYNNKKLLKLTEKEIKFKFDQDAKDEKIL